MTPHTFTKVGLRRYYDAWAFILALPAFRIAASTFTEMCPGTE